MPFDPEPITKPDVFSVEGLIAWLETQNPATKYDYCRAYSCLLTQYFADRGGHLDAESGYLAYRVPDGRCVDLWGSIFHRVAVESRTFGEAADRARTYLAKQEGA